MFSYCRYAIIPMSYRNWHQYEVQSHDGHVPYVLALFSAKVLEWQEQVPTKPGFMAESLFLLAKKEGVEKKVICRKYCSCNSHMDRDNNMDSFKETPLMEIERLDQNMIDSCTFFMNMLRHIFSIT